MSIIDELSNRRQFVLAHLSPKEGGGTDKIPVSPITGDPVDGQDPANHMSGAEASACAVLWGEGYGPGIVIAEGSGLFCIDLDHCREGAGWAPHAHNFIARFPGAYVEVSQSGEGLHIIGSYRGEISAHRTRNKDYRCEAYTRSRFIYLGSQGQGAALADCTEALQAFLAQFFPAHEKTDPGEWRDTPLPGGTCIEDDAELIRRAMNSTSAQAVFGGGTSFAALWTANAEVLGRAFRPDNSYDAWNRSSADLGLANHLCFWTRGNHERMARLMRSCDALYRPKWDRPDYIPRTVRTACEDQTEWYDGRAVPVSAPAVASIPTVPAGAPAPSVPAAAADTTITVELAGLAPVPAAPLAMANLTVNGKGLAEASLPNLVKILSLAQENHRG